LPDNFPEAMAYSIRYSEELNNENIDEEYDEIARFFEMATD
jgi:hypothetical protein